MGNIVGSVFLPLSFAVAIVAVLSFVYDWPVWLQSVLITVSALLFIFGIIAATYWNPRKNKQRK